MEPLLDLMSRMTTYKQKRRGGDSEVYKLVIGHISWSRAELGVGLDDFINCI